MGKQEDPAARQFDRSIGADEEPAPATGMRAGPGPILAGELEACGLAMAAFASSCGLDQSVIESVIAGAL